MIDSPPTSQPVADPKRFTAASSAGLRVFDAGDKAYALQAAQQGGMPVPPWFLVLPEAFFSNMTRSQRDEFTGAREPAKVKYYAQRLQASAKLREELKAAVDLLVEGDPNTFLAVRLSSAEESPGRRTRSDAQPLLYVRPDDIPSAIAELWQAVYSESTLYDRIGKGLPLVVSPPAIIVQKMVRSDVSGVVYGGDPVTGRRGTAVIAAVYGLGTSIISGESDADAYEVSRVGEITRRDIAFKQTAHVLDQLEGHGMRARMLLPSQQEMPALTDSQILTVAELAWRANSLFQCPQEIEWTLEAGRVYLLQSRPAPVIARLPDPDAPEIRWDRRGLAGSHPGVSTPLTFTVARWMQSGAYQELGRALGLSETEIRARNDLFGGLIGLIDGYVYLNTTRVRDLLEILPQPRWHREQLAESLGLLDGVSEPAANSTQSDEILHLDTWNVGKMMSTLQSQASRYEAVHKAFLPRLNGVLAEGATPQDRLRADELVDRLRSIQREVIDRWDAPAANEALAAIAYDMLGQLTKNWCDDTRGELKRDLVRDLDDLPGTEAAAQIVQLANEVAKSEELTATFQLGDRAVVDALLLDERYGTLRRSLAEYIAQYGDVSPDGLKIESTTIRDNPSPLLLEIGKLASEQGASPNSSLLPTRNVTAEDLQASSRARERAERLLNERTIRRVTFHKVLDLAKQRLRDRELYRYEQMRLVAVIRRVIFELGRRFYALGVIDSPRHMLYLELEEVLGFVEGSASSANLKGLIELRRNEYSERRNRLVPPAETITTYGVVYVGQTMR